MALIPNSEVYGDNGDVTHFGIIDPITGEPSLIPHVGGNYAMFGGGSGVDMTQSGGNSGGAQPSDWQNLQSANTNGLGGPAALWNRSEGMTPHIETAPITPQNSANSATPEELDKLAKTLPTANTPKVTTAMPSVPDANTQNNGAAAPYNSALDQQQSYSPQNLRTTSTGITEKVVDPALLNRLESGSAAEKQAVDAKAKADIAESVVRQQQAETNSTALAEHQRAKDEMERQYQSNVANKQKEIEGLTDKYLNTPLDANHMWHEMGTGGKITAGIAIALGALGGALSGTNGNVGLDLINKAIERDIKMQEMNLDKTGKAIQQKRGILSDYRDQFGDMDKAKEAAFITYQKAVASHFDALAQSAHDPGTAAVAARAKAELDQSIALKTADLTAKTVEQKETTAPLIKPTAINEKALGQLRANEVGSQKIQEILDQLKTPEGKAAFGRPAQAGAYIKDVLGMQRDPQALNLQTGVIDTVESQLEAAGRMNEEKRKNLRAEFGSIGTNPENLRILLEREKRNFDRSAQEIRDTEREVGHIVPQSRSAISTDDKRADVLKKSK